MAALKPTTSIVDDEVKKPNKFNSILTAVQNAGIESFKATSAYGFALFSSAKSLASGISAAFATAKALGNLAKLALYDTTRVAANTLYYQDEKASAVAKSEGFESLSACSKEMKDACAKTADMLYGIYDATLEAIHGLEHTKEAMHYAWDAACHTRDAAYDAFVEPPADTAKIDAAVLEKIVLIP